MNTEGELKTDHGNPGVIRTFHRKNDLEHHQKTKGRRTRGEEDGKQRAFQILSVPLWLVQMLCR